MAKKRSVKKQSPLEKIASILSNIESRISKLEKGDKVRAKSKSSKTNIDEEEDILTSKPKKNLFDSMPERNLHKEDSLEDQKLWKNRQPTERNRASNRKSMLCGDCNQQFDVFNPEMYLDSKYYCNDCIAGKGKR